MKIKATHLGLGDDAGGRRVESSLAQLEVEQQRRVHGQVNAVGVEGGSALARTV